MRSIITLFQHTHVFKHKNTWLNPKMNGSTQKFPTQHASVFITIIQYHLFHIEIIFHILFIHFVSIKPYLALAPTRNKCEIMLILKYGFYIIICL